MDAYLQRRGAQPAQAHEPERFPAPYAAVPRPLPDRRRRTSLDEVRRVGHRKRESSGI